jgi:L-lactate utilization protein LutC
VDVPARLSEPLATALVDAFLAALERRRATGEVVRSGDAAARAVECASTWSADRALVASDPLLDRLGIGPALDAAGVEVLWWPTDRGWKELMGLEGTAETCGVTAPIAGVAERGTLLLAASEGHGRSLDVVSRYHLAVIPAERIVETLAEALNAAYAGQGLPPSAISLVSGPSRTSDIEKISTLGAHGALAQHVLVVVDERPS